MSLTEIKVPDIGDFDEVAVIEVLVKVGDTVKAEQEVIEAAQKEARGFFGRIAAWLNTWRAKK